MIEISQYLFYKIAKLINVINFTNYTKINPLPVPININNYKNPIKLS